MFHRQGSITALFNQNRKLAERYSYDAWGRRRNPANWLDYNVKAPRLISRGYTGHEMLDGFGLINMNGRMYDPVIGRVLSPDPSVQSPTYTQNYNRYSYCLNNPLRYTDPSGYFVHPTDWRDEPVILAPYFGDGGGSSAGRFNPGNMYYNALWDDRAPSDGGGNFGLPGESDNGTELNGVYYDWESRTYRSTLLGYREVGWEYAYKHSVLPALKQQEQERQLAYLQLHPQSKGNGLLASLRGPVGGKTHGGIMFGGIMFYNDAGNLLYRTGIGTNNIIYTVSIKNISSLMNAVNAYLDYWAQNHACIGCGNIFNSPNYFQKLADTYSDNSYNAYVVNGAVIGDINAPWYMYAAAALSISGEGFAEGRAVINTKNNGLKDYYGTSVEYGVKNYWTQYFEARIFAPWW
jgi:RHS repeat-associated protein